MSMARYQSVVSRRSGLRGRNAAANTWSFVEGYAKSSFMFLRWDRRGRIGWPRSAGATATTASLRCAASSGSKGLFASLARKSVRVRTVPGASMGGRVVSLAMYRTLPSASRQRPRMVCDTHMSKASNLSSRQRPPRSSVSMNVPALGSSSGSSWAFASAGTAIPRSGRHTGSVNLTDASTVRTRTAARMDAVERIGHVAAKEDDLPAHV